MEPTVLGAFITGGFSLASAAIGYYIAGRRGGSRESSSASGPPPRPVSTFPLDQQFDVPDNVRPTVAFSKNMDPATISPNTFKLLDAVRLETILASSVDYDVDARAATFTPRDPFEEGRLYQATITARVKDQAGNRLEENHTWHFRVFERKRGKGEY